MKMDRVAVLGGAGIVGRVVTRVLHESRVFKHLTIADLAAARPEVLAREFGAGNLNHLVIDLNKKAQLDRLFEEHPVVFNATPYRFGKPVYEAALRQGGQYFDLGGVLTDPDQWDDLDRRARSAGAVLIFNCGATPGLTNLLAMAGARTMTNVRSVQVAFATFRPLTLSPGLLSTVLDEFAPVNPDRRIFEKGRLIPMPPFARRRRVEFLAPVGRRDVYVVPHEETFSLSRLIPGVESASTHGTWRPGQMNLIRRLNGLGLLSDDPIVVDGAPVSPRRFTEALVLAHPLVERERGFHFYLHVQVEGEDGDGSVRRVFRTRHPDWGAETTGMMTGIPAALAAAAMASKKTVKPGAYNVEQLVDLEDIRKKLDGHGVEIQESVER